MRGLRSATEPAPSTKEAALTKLLVIRKYEKACGATSFQELNRRLSSAELYDLCHILHESTGRQLQAPFVSATPEDWQAIKVLVQRLGDAAATINAMLAHVDWEDSDQILGAVDKLENDALKETAEYGTVLRRLAEDVKIHLALEDSEDDHEDLIAFKTLPPQPVLDETAYDCFISYKTSRHAAQAAALASRLMAQGYRVWFDKLVLEKMQNRPERFEAPHLIAILSNAIRRSKCTIMFEAVMHATSLLPGVTEEDALARHTVMRVPGSDLLAWDWQVLEVANTERGIAIHPSAVVAFRVKDGKTIWTETLPYRDQEECFQCILRALTRFAD
jgi:hypothetical protein